MKLQAMTLTMDM